MLGAGMAIFMVFLGVTTLLDRNSSTAMWAGLSFGSGFGSGLAFMMPFVLSDLILLKYSHRHSQICARDRHSVRNHLSSLAIVPHQLTSYR